MATVEGLLSEANAAAPFELLFTHAWLVLVRDSDWHLSLPQGWFSQISLILDNLFRDLGFISQ